MPRSKGTSRAPGRLASWLGISAPLLAAGWAVLAEGCLQDTACIEWDESLGACPPRDEALARMTVPCGRVQRVLSEGEFDEDACCYEVRQLDDDLEAICATGPGGPSGPGAGVTGSTSSGNPPIPCGATIEGACGACAEQACCTELSNCGASVACIGCVNEGNCADASAGLIADALFGCLAAAQCEGDPCQVAVTPPPVCAAGPGTPPSAGSCVTLGPQACNPITNEGCKSELGEACDVVGGAFVCVSQTHGSPLCSGCGATGFCGPGATCYGALCAEYCCTDDDCGGGTCSAAVPLPLPGVGICVQAGG
jgi:hypothetical protein